MAATRAILANACRKTLALMTCGRVPKKRAITSVTRPSAARPTYRAAREVRQCGRDLRKCQGVMPYSQRASNGATHREHDHDRAKQNAEIHEERPLTDVMRLERHDLLEIGHLVAPRHLPRPRDSGLHIEAGVMMFFVERHFRRQRRPRPDERHLTPQHIDELRKLVETRPPQPGAQPGDARVTQNLEEAAIGINAALEQLVPMALSIRHHRPELEDLEKPAAPPDPVLPDEHGS